MADETAVTRLAAAQNGLITRAQLRALGFSPGMMQHRFRIGRWTPLGRSVIAIGPAPQDLMGRSRAASLAVPEGVLSHTTAALLHHLPGMFLSSATERRLLALPVDISSTASRGRTRPGDMIVHRRSTKPRSLYLHGMRVTTVPQTVLDLATVLDEAHLDRVIDMTLAQNRCSLEALGRLLDLGPSQGVTGRATLRSIVGSRHRPGGSASALERLFWESIKPSGLPLPDRQVPMPWGATVDLLWAVHRLIGELDSRSWHERRRDREHDARRDAEALSQGYATFRMTWEMVTDEPDITLQRLAQALAQRRP